MGRRINRRLGEEGEGGVRERVRVGRDAEAHILLHFRFSQVFLRVKQEISRVLMNAFLRSWGRGLVEVLPRTCADDLQNAHNFKLLLGF